MQLSESWELRTAGHIWLTVGNNGILTFAFDLIRLERISDRIASHCKPQQSAQFRTPDLSTNSWMVRRDATPMNGDDDEWTRGRSLVSFTKQTAATNKTKILISICICICLCLNMCMCVCVCVYMFECVFDGEWGRCLCRCLCRCRCLIARSRIVGIQRMPQIWACVAVDVSVAASVAGAVAVAVAVNVAASFCDFMNESFSFVVSVFGVGVVDWHCHLWTKCKCAPAVVACVNTVHCTLYTEYEHEYLSTTIWVRVSLSVTAISQSHSRAVIAYGRPVRCTYM